MKKIVYFFIIFSFLVSMAGPLQASPAIDFSSVLADFTFGDYSLGFEFSTNSLVTVTALGFYDDLQDGLSENHTVGMYDSVGILLVSTTVGNSDPLTGFFRFHDITPVNLAAGQTYFIQAVTGSENYTAFTNDFSVDPRITYRADAYYSPASGVLAFPNASDGLTELDGGGYLGPNFIIGTVAPVPVPPAVFLLSSGLLVLAGWRHFRKQ